ncbi:hypothetical protein BKA65DRAFT_410481 [Rhexocercosporidium sp. MPI-PUGE-AT-0058]|nr:hypothetical protein BKA65DRAFT_410481 [Rhexocercosporidium sp. MPI-PUGE-AT-0058]
MSIFSKLKASKKAAKDHKAAEKQKDPDAVVVVPYKHTPTHAAVDALSGAPSSWSRDDRPKIKEQHKRRSEMVMSRTPSSLSTMSYMNSAAGPSSQAPPLPRNASYNSFNPTWFDKMDGANDHRQNRYRPQRGHSYHDSGLGPSPLGSNIQSEEVSPVVSSGTSTNSNNSSDNLEIAGPSTERPVNTRQLSKTDKPKGTVFAEQDIFDRLHTSTARKLGEAPLFETPQGPKPRTPTKAAPVVEQKPKKQRWSLLGKKNTAAVSS